MPIVKFLQRTYILKMGFVNNMRFIKSKIMFLKFWYFLIIENIMNTPNSKNLPKFNLQF